MFSAQLDAASEAHIARGYVPCTPATLCLHPLHPLHPLQPCNAPFLSCTDASPSHFAILNVRRLFIEIQYLQVKLLPQMSATLHLSYIPDSPEPNASHPSSTFWMKPHLGWKFHLPAGCNRVLAQSSSIYRVRMHCIPVWPAGWKQEGARLTPQLCVSTSSFTPTLHTPFLQLSPASNHCRLQNKEKVQT